MSSQSRSSHKKAIKKIVLDRTKTCAQRYNNNIVFHTLHVNEIDLMDSLWRDNHAYVFEAFMPKLRYLYDLLNIVNAYFECMINHICPPRPRIFFYLQCFLKAKTYLS